MNTDVGRFLTSITAKDAENAKHVINNLCDLCALCGEDIPKYPGVET